MDVEVLLGIKRFDVVGLAETFLKQEEKVRVTGDEWYSWNRDGGKQANGDMGVLVHKSLESSVRKSREGLVSIILSCVGRGYYM